MYTGAVDTCREKGLLPKPAPETPANTAAVDTCRGKVLLPNKPAPET